MTRRSAELLLALLLVSGAAQAQDSSGDRARAQLEALRPSGPVTIKADRVDWIQNQSMKYSGNVLLSSATLSVRGAEMEVLQSADGHFVATVRGAPAQLDHAPAAASTGLAAQPVHAEAREIRYDSREGTADMLGAAKLARGADEISGETIGYIVNERRIRAASGGSGGQVTITFEPPPPKTPPAKSGPKSTPAKTPDTPR